MIWISSNKHVERMNLWQINEIFLNIEFQSIFSSAQTFLINGMILLGLCFKNCFKTSSALKASFKFTIYCVFQLKALPSFFHQLNALQKFNLSTCSKLKKLPSSTDQLNTLQQLNLSDCCHLKKLPSSISQLNAFQQLDLSVCSNLKELPSSLGQLNALQELDLS